MNAPERNPSQELAQWIGQLLDRKGGLNIQILDVRDHSSITDFMVIATGTSSRHIQTLMEAPCMEMKKNGFPALQVEGGGTNWVVADFGDVILHVFDEATRRHYDLEGLWQSARKIEWDTRKQSPIKIVSL